MTFSDGRTLSHEVLEQYRLRTIVLYEKGEPINQIAEYFGIHRGSVSRWITTYNRQGKTALKSKKALGPQTKIPDENVPAVLAMLENDAMQYGFETPLWTCQRLRIMLKRNWNVSLHSTNVMRLLNRWKITPQKPRRQAIERDDAEVKKWLGTQWPLILEHVNKWHAILYFQDEAGVSLTPVMGRTWAPRGKTPVIRVTGHKGGVTVTSAISPSGRMLFRLEKARVNALKHVEFLEQILRHHPRRKIIVIEDSAPVHKAKFVSEFVAKNGTRLAIYRIPSYSPELNPDEHVWEYLKGFKLKSHQAQTKKELHRLVLRKMQGIQRKRGLVNSFFADTYVT
jgi:transposase